jgi:hypothetical protein
MWRELDRMTDCAGRRYRCRYKIVATDDVFYTDMRCVRGRKTVHGWVNSAT